MKRVRYTVTAFNKGWRIKRAGKDAGTFYCTKRSVVPHAANLARQEWQRTGVPTELIIFGLDGKLQDNRTYGRDPRRSKG